MSIDLFCSFIRYEDTAVQIICTFSCSIHAKPRLIHSMCGEVSIKSLARIERKNVHIICTAVSLQWIK